MKINKPLYYILNVTWGLPLTLVGALVALGLLITGHKPKRHGGCLYFNVGNWWGGVNLGLIFLTDKVDAESVKNHEYGHSLQNAAFGPLMIPLIAIPSAIRYWIQRYRQANGLKRVDYDAIWFEGQATYLGNNTIDQW